MPTEDPAARTVTLWVAMSTSGAYQVGIDEHDALERLTQDHDCRGLYRNVCLMVTMAPPEIVAVDVAVPDEAPGAVTVEHRARHCDRRTRNRSPRVTG